jgi:hypothetical protein
LNKRNPGQWSIWQPTGKSIIPERELTPDLAFQIDFTKSIVSPHPTNSYEDIITFRDRHREELISLRHHIEEIAIKLS